MEHILRHHDNARDKGVPLDTTRVHTLGYPNDLALTADNGDADGVARATATQRATEIVAGSRVRADMEVKIKKNQGPTRPTPRPSHRHYKQ